MARSARSTSLRSFSRAGWLSNRNIRVVLHLSLRRFDDLPNVPALVEFAKTESDRALVEFFVSANAIGRVVAAPPEMPPPLVALLRTAFDETMRDDDFVADCRQSESEVEPLGGAGLPRWSSAPSVYRRKFWTA
jgi:tripartite-type tricarboxylate transporter receptor subunit TctC